MIVAFWRTLVAHCIGYWFDHYSLYYIYFAFILVCSGLEMLISFNKLHHAIKTTISIGGLCIWKLNVMCARRKKCKQQFSSNFTSKIPHRVLDQLHGAVFSLIWPHLCVVHHFEKKKIFEPQQQLHYFRTRIFHRPTSSIWQNMLKSRVSLAEAYVFLLIKLSNLLILNRL